MVSYAAVPGPISAPVAEEVVIKLLPVLGDLAAVTAVITALRGGVLLRVGAGDLGLLVEGDVGGDVAAVAEHGQGGGVAGAVALQRRGQILTAGQRGVTHLGDHVAQAQAGLVAGAALDNGVDEHALIDVDAVLSGHLGVHGAHGHGHVCLAGDGAVLHDVGDDGLHIVNGNGEAQTLHRGGGVGGVLGGHDAHHLAVQVHQGAAGVAGVDGAVHLDHVEGGAVHVDGAVAAGHIAAAHGERQLAQGIADGQHGVTHVHIGAVAQCHGGQPGGVDLQHRHVVVAVAADDGGIVGVAVIQRYLHGGGAADHVVVGDDVAVLADDKAAAAGGGLGGLTEHVGGGGAVDGHGGVHRGGVHLGGLHLGLAVHLLDLHGSGRAVTLIDGGLAAGGAAACQRSAAVACRAAHHSAGQHQRRDLYPRPAEKALLLHRRGIRVLLPGCGRVVVAGHLPVGEAVHIVVVEFVVIHRNDLLCRSFV